MLSNRGRCKPERWECEALADGSREAEKWLKAPQVGDEEPSSSICACERCGSQLALVRTHIAWANASIHERRPTNLLSMRVTKGQVAVHALCVVVCRRAGGV